MPPSPLTSNLSRSSTATPSTKTSGDWPPITGELQVSASGNTFLFLSYTEATRPSGTNAHDAPAPTAPPLPEPSTVILFQQPVTEVEYFLGSFGPVILCTLLSIFVHILCRSLREILPFCILTRPAKSTASDSVCLELGGIKGLLTSFRMFRKFHDPLPLLCDILVACSALLTSVSSSAIGIAQICPLPGPRIGCYISLGVFADMRHLAESLLGAMALILATMMMLIWRLQSGLPSSPGSIAAVASLLPPGAFKSRLRREGGVERYGIFATGLEEARNNYELQTLNHSRPGEDMDLRLQNPDLIGNYDPSINSERPLLTAPGNAGGGSNGDSCSLSSTQARSEPPVELLPSPGATEFGLELASTGSVVPQNRFETGDTLSCDPSVATSRVASIRYQSSITSQVPLVESQDRCDAPNATPNRELPTQRAQPAKYHAQKKASVPTARRFKREIIPIMFFFVLCPLFVVVSYYESKVMSYDDPLEYFMDSEGLGVRILFTGTAVVIGFFWEYVFSRAWHDIRNRSKECWMSCPQTSLPA
ncbi:hypothetical protein GQ53DRAFT_863892 [Thozetella sp. PMI_491]|nr:hypothetical protein GQ53DRAFT_863892 [Thozetella sp. PMI_491]